MEGEGIDGPYVVYVVDGLAMAFERVFFVLNGWTGVKVFDRYSTFRGSARVS
jgi:hypothetical protein